MADVRTAARTVRRAEAAVEEAQRALAGARIELDIALSERGWRTVSGGYGPGAEAVYERNGDAMAVKTLPALLAEFEAA